MRSTFLISTCFAVAVATTQAKANADSLTPSILGIHTITHHVDSGKHAPGAIGWNNNNFGLYAVWSNGFTVGHYTNSINLPSTYAGWTFSTAGGMFAITAGVVSGYDKVVEGRGGYTAVRCSNTCRKVNLESVLTPMLVPSIKVPLTDGVDVRLSILAPPGQSVAGHVSFEVKF